MSERGGQRWRRVRSLIAATLFPMGLLSAQPNTTLRIVWTAPEGCPISSEVEASIQALLGHPPRMNDDQEVEVKASARLEPDGLWHGQLDTRLGSKTGRRTLQAESCRAVADATALIVALMIDPDAVAAHRPSPSGSASAAPPPSSAPPASPAPPDRNEEFGDRPRILSGSALGIRLGSLIAADTGTLPQPTYGGGARVGVTLDHS